MKVHKVLQALSTERYETIEANRRSVLIDSLGDAPQWCITTPSGRHRYVKGAPLLHSLLARIGCMPVVPAPKVKRKPGPKPKAKGVAT